MPDKILIANRGEIACRVIKTCRRLQIPTVAVYSDADASARHVRMADEAIHIGPAQANESYLDIEKILSAAKTTHATAVHPGYGFLAENAKFADSCAQQGLIFIGPDAKTIRAMGSKAESKKIMQAAGVPTIPGYHDADQSDDALRQAAAQIGFPLLVKASAGGGGKGMRIANSADELMDAIASARREATNAFGDPRLLLEKFLTSPRHIEFQIFGDKQGHVVHLFERDCSIQRRYQKIIEESPSPLLDSQLRAQMAAAAVAAAKAVGYFNAGTVEFIVDSKRQFFFLEMNTRLQVEHPVTEMITGLDLVEWQLAVAAGRPLPLTQDAISFNGHAIEARIYAEDPAAGFIPSSGLIKRLVNPADQRGVRLDTGFEDGDQVSMHYDPMIAKLVCHADDRNTALAQMRLALANTAVFGLKTNLALLRNIAGDGAFAAGSADTGYLDAGLDSLLRVDEPEQFVFAAAIASEMLARERQQLFARSPWDIADGWQANGLTRNRLVLSGADNIARIFDVAGRKGEYTITSDSGVHHLQARSCGDQRLHIEMQNQIATFSVYRVGNVMQVAFGDRADQISMLDPYPSQLESVDDGTHPGSPMPGKIVSMKVKTGQVVEKGQPLLVVEAMKMEYTVRARVTGTVSQIFFGEGDTIEAEIALVDLEPLETQAE